jgi:hypothetical protein
MASDSGVVIKVRKFTHTASANKQIGGDTRVCTGRTTHVNISKYCSTGFTEYFLKLCRKGLILMEQISSH